MGALPKNKITRVERGKRRRGNAPKLKKDLNSTIPQHKQGFVGQLFQWLGLGAKPGTTAAKTTKQPPKTAKPVAKTKSGTSATASARVATADKPTQTSGKVSAKTTTRTQRAAATSKKPVAKSGGK